MPASSAVAVPTSGSRPSRGRPQLTGSPSQIQWAEEIRERLINGLSRNIRAGQGIARAQAMQSTCEWLLGHTDARWWIDNRNYKPTTVNRVRYAEVIDIYGSLLGTKKPPMRAGA